MRPSGRICLKRTAKRAQARRLSRFVIFMPSHAGRAKEQYGCPCVFSRRSVSQLHPPRFAEELGISPESAHRSIPFGRSAATDIFSARHEERRADHKTPALHCMTSSRMRRAHSLCRMQQTQPDAPCPLCLSHMKQMQPDAPRPLCLSHMKQMQPDAPRPLCQRHMQQTQPNAPHSPVCAIYNRRSRMRRPRSASAVCNRRSRMRRTRSV